MTQDHSIVEQHVAAHPFTRGLADSDVAFLQRLAEAAEFEAHDVIFNAGDEATHFYLIRTGVVALRIDTGAAMPRTVQTLSEGSALGWSWLFPPYEWQFTAVAETPVRAVMFDAGQLREHFESDKECGYRLMARVAELMADRLHATRHELAQR